jgi:hypothetical protein
MKYMLNAYITVCECINILVIYKISKNTGTTPLLINPDNFRAAMITSLKLCLDKVIYRLGEFDNFILMLGQDNFRVVPKKNGIY